MQAHTEEADDGSWQIVLEVAGNPTIVGYMLSVQDSVDNYSEYYVTEPNYVPPYDQSFTFKYLGPYSKSPTDYYDWAKSELGGAVATKLLTVTYKPWQP